MTIFKVAARAALGLYAGAALLTGPAEAELTLTRDEVIRRVLEASPTLEAARARVAEYEAAIEQADTRPNPTVGAELENFTGTGPFTGLDRTELTVTYAQQFERGNKRSLRTKLAREEARIGEGEWHIQRLDLIHAAEKAYVEVVAARTRLDQLTAQAAILKDIEGAIRARMEAGKDSELAVQNAHIRYLSAANLVAGAEQELMAAKVSLAGLWGAGATAFSVDGGQGFKLPTALVPMTEASVAGSPDLAIWDLREAALEASLSLEKAKSVQDPTVRVGVRYHQDTSDVAAVAGVSIPLALYDTNQGNIRRARAAVSRNMYERADRERTLIRQLGLAHARQRAAFTTARQLSGSLQAAEDAKALVLERMDKGAASYLDVFAAQSLVADIETQRIAALTQFHLAQADINRLTAIHSTDATMPAATMSGAEAQVGPEGN
ncbi:TolC family protein [Kordiimonas sp.]|uniref:TolC family protein n=1 Tax=Kordiimonas sp. TaxID=1970157 RepID=UPI003A94CCF1